MNAQNKIIPLSKGKKGEHLQIISLPDGISRSQLIRFGIIEGTTIKCIQNLPGGTIVIQKDRQEIAIGHKLSNKIKVIRV